MNTPNFVDAPIRVEAKMTDQQLRPQTIVWQGRKYAVIAIGRQWTAEDGTHVLLEVHDGSRMEVQLGNDLNWRLLRHWPATTTA